MHSKLIKTFLLRIKTNKNNQIASQELSKIRIEPQIMLLKYPSVQFQSINELRRFSSHQSLEKLPNSSFSSKQFSTELTRRKSSTKQFIPFCQERDLGRLLSKRNFLNQKQQEQTQVQKLLEMVTFKNFRKLYRMEKKSEQAKYASKIRVSGQKNLINQEEWILNDIRQKHNKQLKNGLKSSCQTSRICQSLTYPQKSRQNQSSQLRSCCKSTHLSNQPNLKPQNKSMNKIDLQLYKKLAANRPPSSKDPQLNTLYEHYVQSCQLNENQRRRFLTQRKK